MAGKRKVYTPEFKLAAVKMITDQKLSGADPGDRRGNDAVLELFEPQWRAVGLAVRGLRGGSELARELTEP